LGLRLEVGHGRDHPTRQACGFGHDNTDPHDFFPDYESNSEAEIAAWEKAKAECPNHPPTP